MWDGPRTLLNPQKVRHDLSDSSIVFRSSDNIPRVLFAPEDYRNRFSLLPGVI